MYPAKWWGLYQAAILETNRDNASGMPKRLLSSVARWTAKYPPMSAWCLATL